MSLLAIIITLVVVGVLLYLVNKHVPMDADIKQVIKVLVIIVVIIWLLQIFGLWNYIDNVHVHGIQKD